ncbi:MAG: FHA domain-containing protein [bacterium]|nr:MAG: FHA domain-containing protein [bacterium]
MITCLECNAENFDGALYCENCGADLEGILAAENPSEQEFIPVGGPTLKLVLTDTGEEIGLPEKNEILLGREDPVSAVFPDIDTTPYNGEEDGVSRQHAKIFQQGNEYYIEDLDSVNSTFLNKVKLDPNIPSPITNGDELMLGRLKFRVSLS